MRRVPRARTRNPPYARPRTEKCRHLHLRTLSVLDVASSLSVFLLSSALTLETIHATWPNTQPVPVKEEKRDNERNVTLLRAAQSS